MSEQFKFQALMEAKADLSAWKAYRKELQDQVKAAQGAGKSTKGLERELKRVDGQLKRSAKGAKDLNREQRKLEDGVRALSREFPALGRAMEVIQNPKVAGVLAMAAALGALKKAVGNFAAEELAETGIDAALANQGKLADETREKLFALSNAMEGRLSIANEKFLDSMSTLLKLGADESDIPKLIKDVENLAGILGGGEGSLENAALLVAKAYAGSTETLARYGIVLDDTLDQTEKLEQLSQKLAEGGAGQLEARAKTLTGQWDGFKIALNNAFEAMGGGASRTGFLQATLFGLSETLQGFANQFPGTADVVDGLANRMPKLASEAEEARRAMAGLSDGLGNTEADAQGAADAFAELNRAIEASRRAQDQLISGRAAVALAEVDRDEALARRRGGGELSDAASATFAARRANIRATAEEQRLQNRRQAVQERQAAAEAGVRREVGDVEAAAGRERDRFSDAAGMFEATPQIVGRDPENVTPGDLSQLGFRQQMRLRESRDRLRELEREQADENTFSRVVDSETGETVRDRELQILRSDIELTEQRIQRIGELRDALNALRQAEKELEMQEEQLAAARERAAEVGDQTAQARAEIDLEATRQGLVRQRDFFRHGQAAVQGAAGVQAEGVNQAGATAGQAMDRLGDRMVSALSGVERRAQDIERRLSLVEQQNRNRGGRR